MRLMQAMLCDSVATCGSRYSIASDVCSSAASCAHVEVGRVISGTRDSLRRSVEHKVISCAKKVAWSVTHSGESNI